MKRLFITVFILGLIFFQACNKKDDPTCTQEVTAEKLASVDQTRLTSDIQAIDNYLATNNISGVEYEPNETNGVRYVISSLGTGETISCLEHKVNVKYKGNLLSNPDLTPFDEKTTGISFTLSNLILGWQLVLPLIPSGSKVTLYIPSGYGYGVNGAAGGKIPSNANLIFEIELIGVN